MRKSQKQRLYGLVVMGATCLCLILWIKEKARIPSSQHSGDHSARRPKLHLTTSLKQRSQRIAELCQQEELRNLPTERQLSGHTAILNYRHAGVCYCKVPKSVSTTISRMLQMAEKPINASYLSKLPAFRVHNASLTKSIQVEKCPKETPLSLFVVRDPYSRLFSAYIDKVFLEKFWYLSTIIHLWIHQRQANQTIDINNISDIHGDLKKEYCEVHTVSFKEFLSFKFNSWKPVLDPHFAPATSLCDPCRQSFDAILKQEFFMSESEVIKRYFKDTSVYIAEANNDTADLDIRVKNLLFTVYFTQKSRLDILSCEFSHSDFLTLHLHVWSTLQILGYIATNTEFPPDIFPTHLTSKSVGSEIFAAFKAKRIPYLSRADGEKQRRKYLIQAYSDVTPELIQNIQSQFRLDFTMFGYDIDMPH